MMKVYQDVFYESWGPDRVYQFDRALVEKEFHVLQELMRANAGNRMPVEFFAILRLLGGQHAILADLKAVSNWHRIVFPLLREPNL